MNTKSLGFKLIMGGILAVFVPLLAVGLFASIKSGEVIENLSREQATSLSRSLSTMSQVAMENQLKATQSIAAEQAVLIAADTIKTGVGNVESALSSIGRRLEQAHKSMGNS